MKKQILIYVFTIWFLAGCGTTNNLNKLPEDREVYSLVEKLQQNPGIVAYQKELDNQYKASLLKHQQNIEQYNQSNQLEKWEKIMNEYGQLEKLAETITNSPSAAKAVTVQRFTEYYAQAHEKAVEAYYDQATVYLNHNDRRNAEQAYGLFKKVAQLSPGYKDVNRLMEIADNKSVLKVVINPVNYYSHNFGYYGLNSDYVQQEIVRDLKFQLSSGNVRVYSNWEARSGNIAPDRVIDLEWNELFIPIPRTQTFSRQVSREIQTGQTADIRPVYTTVTATIYVTRRQIDSRGRLSCKVTEPTTNNVVLWDEFPAYNNNVEEYATYRGDSRALSSYDWALVNNSSFRDPSQYDMFNNVFRQVYPQLLNRLRAVTW